jgi:hypothetical protein
MRRSGRARYRAGSRTPAPLCHHDSRRLPADRGGLQGSGPGPSSRLGSPLQLRLGGRGGRVPQSAGLPIKDACRDRSPPSAACLRYPAALRTGKTRRLGAVGGGGGGGPGAYRSRRSRRPRRARACIGIGSRRSSRHQRLSELQHDHRQADGKARVAPAPHARASPFERAPQTTPTLPSLSRVNRRVNKKMRGAALRCIRDGFDRSISC